VTPEAPALRVGVIGCGRVFERFHLPALAREPGVRLIAVSDADPARLAWARSRLPECLAVASADELLAARPDAVLLLTPPPTHAPLAREALAGGIAVLVEKPMALSVDEAAAMVGAARTPPARLQVGFTRRFREPYRLLREALGSSSAPAWVSFELAFPTAPWGAHDGFLGDDSRGGGVLDDVFSHQADLLRCVLGRELRRVRVAAHHVGRAEVEVELDDGLVARCVAAHGSYTELLQVGVADGTALTASGSAFRRRRSGGGRFAARLADRVALARDKLFRRTGATAESFAQQLRDFVGAVRGAPATGATGDDGYAAVAAVAACRRSVKTGTWERVA
jgi:predicted dehydrogenase